MSSALNEIKDTFRNYLLTYEGIKPIRENINEAELLQKICTFVNDNKNLSKEFSDIIKEYLINHEIKYKLKLFNIIDLLFKSTSSGEEFIYNLSPYLYEHFKQCYMEGNFDDRILLFKIFYTWKYLVPSEVTEKIGKDLNMNEMKNTFINKFPGKIEKYDKYNEEIKLKKHPLKKNKIIAKIKPNNNTNNNNNKNLLNKKRKTSGEKMKEIRIKNIK